MLQICFLWLNIVFVLFNFGYLALSLIKENQKEESFELIDHLLIGLVFLTSIVSTISIFYHIGFDIFLITNIISVAIFFWNLKKYKTLTSITKIKFSTFETVIMIITMTLICFYSTYYSTLYDSNTYHIGSVEYIKKYGLIPGLGNLNSRLGTNSSLFAIESLFSNFLVTSKKTYLLNSLFCLLVVLTIIKSKITSNIWLKLGFISIVWFYYFRFFYYFSIATPAPDIFITSMAIIIYFRFNKYQLDVNEKLILFVLALYCVTIKLSALPIGLLSLIYLVHSWKSKTILKSISLVTFILVPYLVANVILSGYLIFPIYQLDLFNFNWKMPIYRSVNDGCDHIVGLFESASWIKSWARVPDRPYQDVLAMPFKDWFIIWLKQKDWSLLLLFYNSFLCVILYCFSFNEKENKNKLTTFFNGIFLLSCHFIFFTNPDFRFGFGYYIPILCFTFSFLFSLVNNLKYPQIGLSLLLLSLCLSSYLTRDILLRKGFVDSSHLSFNRLLFFEGLPEKKLESAMVDNNLIYISDNQMCGYTIPCSLCSIPNVRLRGTTIKSGFIYIK